MIVQVTKLDIQKGKRGVCAQCPIARAIRRAYRLKHLAEVRILKRHVAYIRAKQPHYRLLPANARAFISFFDLGLPVKPFSFRLRNLA